LISILINNYNYARFLDEAIESALAQDYPQVEVVVVDDGSTDDSRDRIDAYGNRVRRVFQANAGQAAAFNAGFAASAGDIVCLLDADDRLRPHKAAAIAQIYAANPTAEWVFHPLALFGDVASPEDPAQNTDSIVDVRSCASRGRLTTVTPATSGLTFRRRLLDRILPMPGEIRITSDNYLKLAALGLAPGVIAGRALADQRIHGSNAYTLNSRVASLRGEIAMMTAYNLRRQFPQLTRLAHGVYARGLAQWMRAIPRSVNGSALARRYLADLGAVEMTEVAARSALNLLRPSSRT
jgi:glycosyltransferase involved in cell wall biosynthesis